MPTEELKFRSLLLVRRRQSSQKLRLLHFFEVCRKLVHFVVVLHQVYHLVLNKTLDKVGDYPRYLAPLLMVLGEALRLLQVL